MKKSRIILLILTIAILGATLAGCSNTPAHKLLNDPWGTEETVTYDVVRVIKDTDTDDANNVKIAGVQTMKTERISGKSISIGDINMDNFTGTQVTIVMTMDDTSYMNAKFAFDANHRPIAVNKEIFVKGYAGNFPELDLKQSLTTQFIGKEYKYKLTTGDVTKEEVLKVKNDWIKKPYFDSIQLYHLARSSFSGKKEALKSFSFDVPSYTENVLKQATINAITNEDLVIGETTYKTTKVAIQYQQKFPGVGKPIYAWYNNETIENFGKRVLMKFEEGTMTYTFKSIVGAATV